MLSTFLLQSAASTAPACGFAGINYNNWIGINMLVVLVSIVIAAAVFAFANMLPEERREKLRGVSRYEMVEAVISIAIVGALIAFTSFSCSAGASLVGQQGYSGLFSADVTYVGNLLFLNGASLVANLFTSSTRLVIAANLLTELSPLLTTSVSSALPGGGIVAYTVSPNFDAFFSKLSGVLTNLFSGFIVITYSVLFLLYLLLPVISAGALTVLAPLSIITRSLAFAGKKLREVSNQLLAIAIGFYFVLPLMLAFNSYMGVCLGIGFGGSTVSCNSGAYFSSYLSGYTLPATSSSILSASTSIPINSATVSSIVPGVGGLNIPISFYGPAFSNFGAYLAEIFNYPGVAQQYAEQIAGYMFLGLVMIALDFAVTIGLIAGLTKGLNAIGSMDLFGSEQFLG